MKAAAFLHGKKWAVHVYEKYQRAGTTTNQPDPCRVLLVQKFGAYTEKSSYMETGTFSCFGSQNLKFEKIKK